MRKTFRYRLYPTTAQKETFDRWLMHCRRLYNAMLDQRIAGWKSPKRIRFSQYDQMRQITELRAAMPEYAAIGAHVLQDVAKRLDKSFARFFAGAGFPKFQGRHRYDSFTFPDHNSWKLKDDRLHIAHCGAVKVKWSRLLEGDIKQVTIKRTKTGKWFVCFSCDNVPVSVWPEPVREAIGVDLGLSSFVTTSEGDKPLPEPPQRVAAKEVET